MGRAQRRSRPARRLIDREHILLPGERSRLKLQPGDQRVGMEVWGAEPPLMGRLITSGRSALSL